jgi:hypothetical protein
MDEVCNLEMFAPYISLIGRDIDIAEVLQKNLISSCLLKVSLIPKYGQ